MNRAPISVQRKYAALISEQQMHPDQPVKSFCRSRKINPANFYYWRNKLQAIPVQAVAQQKFVPVSISPIIHKEESSRYAIRFPNGVTLGISGDFDRAHIAELVDILGGV
jgi:hypothetical protein